MVKSSFIPRMAKEPWHMKDLKRSSIKTWKAIRSLDCNQPETTISIINNHTIYESEKNPIGIDVEWYGSNLAQQWEDIYQKKNGPQNLSNWLGQEFDIPKIEKLDTYKNLQNMQNHISSNYHPGKTVRHLFLGDYINWPTRQLTARICPVFMSQHAQLTRQVSVDILGRGGQDKSCELLNCCLLDISPPPQEVQQI